MKFLCLGVLGLSFAWAEECAPADRARAQVSPLFRELDRRAQIEFRHAEFARASEDFKLAACAVPENLRSAYSLYATAARALAARDWTQARKALREAGRISPESPLPLAMLVKVDLLAGSAEALRGSLSEIARRFGSEGRLHADLAQDLLHENKYDLALAEALRAEAAGFQDPRTRMNLAVLESQAGAFADAARLASEIEEELGLPDSMRAKAAAIAGLNYENSGQFPEAIRHLKESVRLDPNQEIPYIALARIFSSQHDESAAIDVLQQARTRFMSAKVLLALGSALLATEQYPASSKILAELTQRFPKELEAFPKLAEAYRNMGQAHKATQALRQLAIENPEYPMLHVLIAESLLDEEEINYSDVFRELERAQRTSPNDYDVHYLRGRVFMGMRDYRRAAESFRRASELRPTEPGAHYQLGLVYRKLGEADLAKQQFGVISFLKADSTAPQGRN